MGLGRLERPTSRLSGVRSNHLSYRPPTNSEAVNCLRGAVRRCAPTNLRSASSEHSEAVNCLRGAVRRCAPTNLRSASSEHSFRIITNREPAVVRRPALSMAIENRGVRVVRLLSDFQFPKKWYFLGAPVKGALPTYSYAPERR
jgi:hypothetical protein